MVCSKLVNNQFSFQALALVDEETRRYRPTKNYLEHLPPLELSSFEVGVFLLDKLHSFLIMLKWFSADSSYEN